MNVDDFVELVREFLRVVDQPNQRPHALLSTLARLLPRIYAAGLELPDLEALDDSCEPVIHSPWLSFGQYDFYWEIFDPCFESEPVGGSLADDLGDIYVDLARPLAIFEAGQVTSAIWAWRFNIRGHCGDHLVDALRTIHRLIHNHMPTDFDPMASDAS